MTETIDTAIEIAAPPAAVWAVLVDFAHYSAWNPYIVRIDGGAVAGSMITVHSRPLPDGEIMVAPVEVVAINELVAMRWEGGLPDRDQFKGDHRFELEPLAAGRTRLRHYELFSGERAPALLEAHRDTIRAAFVRFNEALKAEVERER